MANARKRFRVSVFANENINCFFAETISADVFRDSRMRKNNFEFPFSREPATENPEIRFELSRKRTPPPIDYRALFSLSRDDEVTQRLADQDYPNHLALTLRMKVWRG